MTKYSAALSGLLNAALSALTTCSLVNPISIRLATVFSYSSPITRRSSIVAGFFGEASAALLSGGFTSVVAAGIAAGAGTGSGTLASGALTILGVLARQ